jgi:hypothetical protein
MSAKNTVVPFPVLSKNEQKYSDVVDILGSYEDIVKHVIDKSGTSLGNVKIHIGGDQLSESTSKQLQTWNTLHICPHYLWVFFSSANGCVNHVLQNTLQREQHRAWDIAC